MSERFQKIAVGAALTLIISTGALAAESGPPLRIGHYSTGSGLIGFVIDRMGTPIKLRFDGSDEIPCRCCRRYALDLLVGRACAIAQG